MELLSISSTLSPQTFPPNPNCSSLKFRKSPVFQPNSHITFASPRNSPQIESLNLGFDEIRLAPIIASSSPQTAMRAAEADVMGLLLRERIVFLGSQIDDFVADAIISQLMLLDAQDHTKDIRLFVNSPGGSLSATMAIFDVVRLIRADVSTVALGIAASTASIILGAGTKGKRLAMPNARIMLHQPLGGASGQAIDVEIQAKEVMQSKDNIIRIVSEFTGRSLEQVEKEIDRDRYMSPIEAVEYGLIDGIIDRDNIFPIEPVPERVKSTLSYEEISKDPRKFLTPDIPNEEIN